MKPTANQIICGNNIDVVKSWPANCIDGLVTDPPYGLGFMGKEWDTYDKNQFGRKGLEGKNDLKVKKNFDILPRYKCDSGFQQWFTVWAKAMLRITKPGGFLLCFGGTRTYHRLACAIEDAGWEIRDCMMWLYGSGFPKSHNISKAIDKAAGAKRRVIGKHPQPAANKKQQTVFSDDNYEWQKPNGVDITAAATDLAQLWDGYGTALKPAWEPIIVAMKPLDGTFAHNAERHGVAGLNIDGGRIGYLEDDDAYEKGIKRAETPRADITGGRLCDYGGRTKMIPSGMKPQGRWPANLILDEEAGAMLDEQSGKSISKKANRGKGIDGDTFKNPNGKLYGIRGHNDSGGASRFFKVLEPEPCFLCGYTEEHGNLNVGPGVYLCDECSLQGEALDLPKRFLYCAKTSRKERNIGMEDCEDKLLARSGGAQGAENRGEDEYLQKHIGLNRVAKVKNNHPTVKPLALMKYLCTLLKMPSTDQVILDPFLGSGTTGMACKELGINFIGIEKEPEYCEISVKRIAAVEGQKITLHTDNPPAEVQKSKPTNDEHRQRIIDAASAALRRNQK